jgi:plastocyanin
MTTTPGTSQTLRWIATMAALVATVLAMAGLGSELASAGPTAQISSTPKIGISGFAFHPPTLKVKAGSSVTFSNGDGVTHTATGAGFDTGEISSGHSKTITFKHKGTFVYHCSIHPSMRGKIVVE